LILNEGSIGGVKQSHYIMLNITADNEDGSISGSLDSRNLATGDDFHVGISGTLFFKTSTITFTKINQGRISDFGKAKIVFNSNKTLKWKLIKEPNKFFPERTELWRS
jgi:hypothetical protein